MRDYLLKEKERIGAILNDIRGTGYQPQDPAVIHYEAQYEEVVRILDFAERKKALETAISEGNFERVINTL